MCGPCPYAPGERTGERACPFTAGYWAFLHRHRDRLHRNPRTAGPVSQLGRLGALDEVLRRERDRGGAPP